MGMRRPSIAFQSVFFKVTGYPPDAIFRFSSPIDQLVNLQAVGSRTLIK